MKMGITEISLNKKNIFLGNIYVLFTIGRRAKCCFGISGVFPAWCTNGKMCTTLLWIHPKQATFGRLEVKMFLRYAILVTVVVGDEG